MKNDDGVKLIYRLIYQLITAGMCMAAILCTIAGTESLRFDIAVLVIVSAAGIMIFTVLDKKIVLASGAVLFVYGMVRAFKMVPSAIYYANDVYDSIFNRELAILAEDVAVEKVYELMEALIYLTLLFSWLIVLNVRFIHSMAMAVVMSASLPMVYTAALAVPSGIVWVAVTVYIVGVAASDNIRAAMAAEAAVACIGAVIILALSGSYTKPEIFVDIQSRTNVFAKNYLGIDLELLQFDGTNGMSVTGTATSVTNGGRLGNRDEVHLSNSVVGYINTPDMGKTQYIRAYVADRYMDSDNTWKSDGMQNQTDTLKEDIYDRGNISRSVFSRYLRNVSVPGKSATDEMFYDIEKSAYSQLYEDIYRYNSTEARSGLMEARQNYLEVPAVVENAISDVVASRKADTLAEKISTINYVERFLENNYSYTLSPGRVPDGEDFASYFLTESKKGYCTYFATAATLILRHYGIPARYVEGYMITEDDIASQTSGAGADTRSKVNVYAKDAHAWTEVYLDGVGWLVLDATPAAAMRAAAERQLANVNNNQDNAADGASDADDNSDSGEDATEETTADTAVSGGEDTASDGAGTGGDGTVSGGSGLGKALIALLCIVCTAAGILAVIYALKRRADNHRKKTENSGDILIIYKSLERLQQYAGMNRPAYMDHIAYARYMEKSNAVFRRNEYLDITKTAVTIMYSGGRYEADVDEKMVKHYICIRDYLYSKMPAPRRLYVKYILAL